MSIKKVFLFYFFFNFLFSFSQDENIGVISINKNLFPEKIETQIIGNLPAYINVHFDEIYQKNTTKEDQLVKKLNSLINELLYNELEADLVNYTNINLKNLHPSLSFLTGGLEHGQFSSKKGFPRKAVKANGHRYQIALSIKSFPDRNNKRTFYYLFIFDKENKKTIGYEQIVVDNIEILDISASKFYLSILIKNLNEIILH